MSLCEMLEVVGNRGAAGTGSHQGGAEPSQALRVNQKQSPD